MRLMVWAVDCPAVTVAIATCGCHQSFGKIIPKLEGTCAPDPAFCVQLSDPVVWKMNELFAPQEDDELPVFFVPGLTHDQKSIQSPG